MSPPTRLERLRYSSELTGSYALTLLLHHPDIFLTSLDPPPNIYLVSPWSPPLPAHHPGWYRSYLSYIPDALINTQHLTVSPYRVNAR